MKKKIIAGLLASVMAVSMLPVQAFASAGGSGTLALTSTVTAPKYVLGVPKAVPIALNPYMIGTDPGLRSGTVYFSNNSNLPVTVNVSLVPKIASDTAILAGDSTATTGGIDNTLKTKQLFMYAEFPTGLDADKIPTTPAAALTLTEDVFTYTAATAAEVAAAADDGSTATKTFKSDTNNTKVDTSVDFSFILEEAVYASGALKNASVDPAKPGFAGFRLGGEVSAYGGWATADLGVNMVYDASVILGAEYDTLTDADDGTAVPVATGTAFAYTTETVSAAFATRQLNMTANDSTGFTLKGNALLTTAAFFEPFTDAAGKTPLASTALVQIDSAGEVTTTNIAAVTTVYVKCYTADPDTSGVYLGIYPVTINPVK